MSKGKLYLTGAGAGDKNFLTIKAYELIIDADAVIYDRLVDPSIIDLIPQNALKVFAGKEPDKHHMTQDEINQKMVDLSSQYQKIIRLKGGDPFIFGRAGEEAEFLKKHDVEFEVIPAISAFQIGATEYNIPLTFRKLSDGLTIISGHKYNSEEPNLDWESLAKLNHTLVIYMGVGNSEVICKRLIENGMNPETPAFAGQEVGTKNSKELYSTLENFAVDIKNQNIKNPAIIVIGEVVRKSQELQFKSGI